jgi:hypothetical protein
MKRRDGIDAQHRNDLLAVAPAHLVHELDARDQIHRAARAEEQAVALDQETRHTHRLGVCYPSARCHSSSASMCQLTPRMAIRGSLPECIVDHGQSELNVLREAVNTNALNDSINLVSPPSALALLVVVHDAVLYLRIFYS